MNLRLWYRASSVSSLAAVLSLGCSGGTTGETGASAGSGSSGGATGSGTSASASGTGTSGSGGGGTGGVAATSSGTGGSGAGGSGTGGSAKPLIGVVPGAGVPDPVTAVAAFGAWMNNGVGVQIVTDYGYPNVKSSTRMTQLGGSTALAQRRGPLTAGTNATPLVWSTALVPSGSTFDAVIQGTDDALFTTEATNMKSFGFSNVIWRLGWECDGHDFLWAVYTGANTAADVATRAAKFVQAFRHVRALIKAVDPNARFEYNSGRAQNPIPGTKNPTQYFPVNDPAASYPGDDSVDFVGVDNYGSDYGSYDYQTNTKGTPAQIWQESLKPLSYMKQFATSHGKPLVVSEWGMMIRADGHGSNDNTYIMQQFITWLNANTYYHTYFNADDHASSPAKVSAFAAAGATSLTLDGTGSIFGTSPNNLLGFIRYGTGNAVREIDYASVDATTHVLSGIPASGHGSIPAGGLAAGLQITEAIQNMCELAVGTHDGDCEAGDQGFHDSPHLPLAAAAYRAGIQ